MFRRTLPALAALALFLGGCAWSERAAIASYFEEAQSIAERMAETGTAFESLMDAQADPLAWSDQAKASLGEQRAALKALEDEAAAMSVPRAFSGAHPLLVRSIGEMVGAVDVMRGIADDPSTATYELANEMTSKAAEGEALANSYVEEVETVLDARYPEMMQE